ncbi:hypothetical protein GCM10009659_25790 [Leucobacter albus]
MVGWGSCAGWASWGVWLADWLGQLRQLPGAVGRRATAACREGRVDHMIHPPLSPPPLSTLNLPPSTPPSLTAKGGVLGGNARVGEPLGRRGEGRLAGAVRAA